MARVLIRIFLGTLLLWSAPLRAEVSIQEVTSPGGIDAWLVEDHTLPFLALDISFAGGSASDPKGREGAAYLMSGLLEEGAGDRDATEFQMAREAMAADFRFDAGEDHIRVSARMLTRNRDEAAALLASALQAPRFDDEAVARVRAQVLSGLAAEASDPGHLAGRDMDRTVFAGHPYARPLEGVPDTVAALTRNDLVAAHRRLITRDGVRVSAVGDISADALGRLLDMLLGDLPEVSPDPVAQADLHLDGAVHISELPTPQSLALFVQPGLARDDPDFMAAFILNQIVGGSGLQSRLMTSLREERGLTYGVYSYLTDRDGAALWQGSFASANGTMGDAIDLVRDEWARVQAEGVRADELAAAKTYLTGAYPLRFDGNGSIAGILTAMQVQGFGPDYIANRNALVEAVTLRDVNRVASERADPGALTFFVAGQPDLTAAP